MKHLYYLSIFILFSSCNSLYKPTTLNVPLHEEAGDAQIAGGWGVSGAELQLSYALTDNFYVSGNGQFLIKRTKEDSMSNYKSFDIAAGYYSWLDAEQSIKLDVALGYGPGNLDYHYLVQTIPMQVRFHVSSFYHRWYIQPSLGFNIEDTDFAISMRAVVIHHSNFTDHYNQLVKNVTYNPLAYLEPAVTYRKGFKNFKLTAQTGLIWPMTPRHALQRPVISGYASVGVNFRFNVLR
jgi:hypothetical protein